MYYERCDPTVFWEAGKLASILGNCGDNINTGYPNLLQNLVRNENIQVSTHELSRKHFNAVFPEFHRVVLFMVYNLPPKMFCQSGVYRYKHAQCNLIECKTFRQ